jgi:DNA anti-recombination protein RmuC
MATKTTEDMLAEIRRHIDELEARADSGAAGARARLQGRFDLLREQEASARTAVREKAEAVDEKFRQLEIDIAIAENRLTAELAEDATSFADAVEAELRDWDAAIERLQTRAATRAQNARKQAETEIAELRQARNRAAERLTSVRVSSGDAWQEQKQRVTEALDDLERRVRETAREFPVRRET